MPRDDIGLPEIESRFRIRYLPLSNEQTKLLGEVRTKAMELEALYAKVHMGRYNSLALTSLEQSVLWITKELTG